MTDRLWNFVMLEHLQNIPEKLKPALLLINDDRKNSCIEANCSLPIDNPNEKYYPGTNPQSRLLQFTIQYNGYF